MLDYTLIANLAFRKPGEELASALVAVLPSQGFELSLSGRLRRDSAPGHVVTVTASTVRVRFHYFAVCRTDP